MEEAAPMLASRVGSCVGAAGAHKVNYTCHVKKRQSPKQRAEVKSANRSNLIRDGTEVAIIFVDLPTNAFILLKKHS